MSSPVRRFDHASAAHAVVVRAMRYLALSALAACGNDMASTHACRIADAPLAATFGRDAAVAKAKSVFPDVFGGQAHPAEVLYQVRQQIADALDDQPILTIAVEACP